MEKLNTILEKIQERRKERRHYRMSLTDEGRRVYDSVYMATLEAERSGSTEGVQSNDESEMYSIGHLPIVAHAVRDAIKTARDFD